MKLKIKRLKFNAGRPIAIMNEKTAKRADILVGERILLKKGGRSIVAIVDTISEIKENEIIVSEEIKKELKLGLGVVEVERASKPFSINLILKKLKGKKLDYKEYLTLMRDISNNVLSEAEIAFFVSSVYLHKIENDEITNMIKAIANSGKILNIEGKIADKHSIGGIPNNRTTPLIVSIATSLGLIMPKTSSRAITSAAGTADVIETLARVDFSLQEIKRIVKKTNGCMVWGGSLGLAPADDKLIRVERLLHLDPEAQLIASILSKKLSVRAKYVIMDIPFGKNTKVEKEKNARRLAKRFEVLAKKFGMKLVTFINRCEEPIGSGIGPNLEMNDVIAILKRKNENSMLKSKALNLVSLLISLYKNISLEKARELAEEVLESGEAYEKFKEIIEEQNGKIKKLKMARYKLDIQAKKSGKIVELNNRKINWIARFAGCPFEKNAGVYLYKHLNEKVKKGEKIMRIYANSKKRIEEIKEILELGEPFKIK